MATNTVVGVFDDHTEAERAVADLAGAGFDRGSIRVTSSRMEAAVTAPDAAGASRDSSPGHESLGERIGHFFRSLFGQDDADGDAGRYSEAVRRGSTLVAVETDDAALAEQAADILQSHGAIDVDERIEERHGGEWAGSARRSDAASDVGATPGRDTVVPVVEEQLKVGKRWVRKGGVRIYTSLSDAPVQQEITLREEHAKVERRPADRPATEADFAAFKEGTLEVRETVEEPVVEKRARVVEEVVVGKEISERTTTIDDSVRQGNVDVQPLESDASAATTGRGAAPDDADFRSHWQTNYARAGGAYDEYAPAYRYGSTLAADERYRNRDWDAIEADARRDWDARHPGGTWERFKAAVRHGWEKMTGRR